LILIVSGILLGLYNLNRPGNPTLEESDIILICTGLMMGAIGLLADLIVATRRA
jgi:hypothetical protein